MELEAELKQRAGENKKFSSSEQNQPLPQVDGLEDNPMLAGAQAQVRVKCETVLYRGEKNAFVRCVDPNVRGAQPRVYSDP